MQPSTGITRSPSPSIKSNSRPCRRSAGMEGKMIEDSRLPKLAGLARSLDVGICSSLPRCVCRKGHGGQHPSPKEATALASLAHLTQMIGK